MGLANIVYWSHQTNKKGEHPIFIRITEDRKSRYIKTGLNVRKEDWDFEHNVFKTKYRRAEDQDKVQKHDDNNKLLRLKLEEAESIITSLNLSKSLISSEQVKNEILKAKKIGKSSLLSYIDTIVNELKKNGKVGTSNCYRDLKRSLKKFLETQGLNDITFIEVTPAFLKKYENDFRSRSTMDNGISFYFRSLRAVMNRAISEGHCKKEIYPFDSYKVSKFSNRTNKRALSKKEIEKIINLELEPDSKKDQARNIFLFSYYNRGINFSDIAMLKWENIKNDRLIYVRLKTSKAYNVKLLEPSLKILNHYKENYFRGNNGYIFPILDIDKHQTPVSIKNRIHKILGETNKDLKTIGEEAEITIPLTTYVARHSFATVMKRSGVSTSIISEALGHDSEKTTQIYLDSFENDVLDEASRAIL